MGVALSCNKCPTAETSSVVNLSDKLVQQMVLGTTESRSKDSGLSADDKDWIEKLKCLDDSHSTVYGLTYQKMIDLLVLVDAHIKDGAVKKPCQPDMIKSSYQNNSNCSIRCARDVAQFIDCLDAKRLEILKEKMMEHNKQKELAAAAKRKSEKKSKMKN